MEEDGGSCSSIREAGPRARSDGAGSPRHDIGGFPEDLQDGSTWLEIPPAGRTWRRTAGAAPRSERQVLGPDLTGRVSRGKASGLEAWSEDLQDDSMRLKILPAGRTWKRMAGAAPRSERQVLGPDLMERAPRGMTLEDFPRISKTVARGSRSHLQVEHGGGRRELLLDLRGRSSGPI